MMLGSRWAMGLALVGTPAIWADIQSAEIVPLGGIHPDGIAVYQVVVNFDNWVKYDIGHEQKASPVHLKENNYILTGTTVF